MTEYTSALASKRIKALEEEKTALLAEENENSTYTRQVGEEEAPPVYSFSETRARIREIDDEVRKIRCGLHRFNLETVLPEFDITIDEALVLLAQLSAERKRVNRLARTQTKQRVATGGYYSRSPAPPEYCYANYDVAEAQVEDKALQERIMALQMALDLANQTVKFEA